MIGAGAKSLPAPARPDNVEAGRISTGLVVGGMKCRPDGLPNGFAAIPTAALDPPRSAASPPVAALLGSGFPSSATSKWPHSVPYVFQAAAVRISASF
jgi:hypothetical protein